MRAIFEVLDISQAASRILIHLNPRDPLFPSMPSIAIIHRRQLELLAAKHKSEHRTQIENNCVAAKAKCLSLTASEPTRAMPARVPPSAIGISRRPFLREEPIRNSPPPPKERQASTQRTDALEMGSSIHRETTRTSTHMR